MKQIKWMILPKFRYTTRGFVKSGNKIPLWLNKKLKIFIIKYDHECISQQDTTVHTYIREYLLCKSFTLWVGCVLCVGCCVCLLSMTVIIYYVCGWDRIENCEYQKHSQTALQQINAPE